jgi:nanoRNase/pAp phosphatase (c-di-AMP/oligoRNAs hydrolase)
MELNKANEAFERMIREFERHKVDLERQMEMFLALQNEVQKITKEAPHSADAAKKLERLRNLEQSAEYITLREKLVEKLGNLEESFGKLETTLSSNTAVAGNNSARKKGTGGQKSTAASSSQKVLRSKRKNRTHGFA